jgi:hypothetical protein
MRKIIFTLLAMTILASCKKSDTGPTIVFQDDLTVDQGTWIVDSTNVHLKKFYQGHYLLKVDSVPNIISFSLAPFAAYNYPYSVQVDAMLQLDNATKSGHVGIIFNRTDQSDYCIAEISNMGTYHIWERIAGVISDIAPSASNSAIKTGLSVKNTIEIIQSSASLQLLINNVSIGSYTISLPSAASQVGISTSTNLVPSTGLFNNFVIKKL